MGGREAYLSICDLELHCEMDGGFAMMRRAAASRGGWGFGSRRNARGCETGWGRWQAFLGHSPRLGIPAVVSGRAVVLHSETGSGGARRAAMELELENETGEVEK